MVNFLEFCESYSGIDGGDITGKYWFVGMEWADWGDEGIAKYYKNDKWIPVEKPEYTNIDIEERDENDKEKVHVVVIPSTMHVSASTWVESGDWQSNGYDEADIPTQKVIISKE